MPLCVHRQTITSSDGKKTENRNVGTGKGRNEHSYVNGKRKRGRISTTEESEETEEYIIYSNNNDRRNVKKEKAQNKY
jgi:hypothetical protein